MKNELYGLFQKFIDNSMNTEELDRFLALLNDGESAAQIRQLMVGLWDYLAMTEDQQSDQFSEAARSLLRKKQRLLERLMAENDRKHREMTAATEKTRQQGSNPDATNKKRNFWRWLRKFFSFI